jgi:DNA-binding beta-propeller fold protein YncE
VLGSFHVTLSALGNDARKPPKLLCLVHAAAARPLRSATFGAVSASGRRGALALVSVLAILILLEAAAGAPRAGTAASRAAPGLATQSTGTSPRVLTSGSRRTGHFEYVLPDGEVDVYDIDRGHRLVQRIALPQARGVRGAAASARTGILYVSYGGDGGRNGSGSMLAFDLVRGRVLWRRDYDTGVDSMAITPDGRTIYLPTGELSTGSDWLVVKASTGVPAAVVRGGAGPHNTVVGLDGRFVYLGGRDDNYLAVVATATNEVVRRVGPLRSGVRPFTVNGTQTLAFTTATGFLGFQVSSLVTGRVLYTVDLADYGFTWDRSTFKPSAPSHGISLSPNERELYVVDVPNSYVHVFDVSGLPSSPPRHVADVKLRHQLVGDESDCTYDCLRDAWLQHSRDGRFVYVGDSGDVIATRTRAIAFFLPALRNTLKSLEIDWRGGRPVATTSRTGLGYVRRR